MRADGILEAPARSDVAVADTFRFAAASRWYRYLTATSSGRETYLRIRSQ